MTELHSLLCDEPPGLGPPSSPWTDPQSYRALSDYLILCIAALIFTQRTCGRYHQAPTIYIRMHTWNWLERRQRPTARGMNQWLGHIGVQPTVACAPELRTGRAAIHRRHEQSHVTDTRWQWSRKRKRIASRWQRSTYTAVTFDGPAVKVRPRFGGANYQLRSPGGVKGGSVRTLFASALRCRFRFRFRIRATSFVPPSCGAALRMTWTVVYG